MVESLKKSSPVLPNVRPNWLVVYGIVSVICIHYGFRIQSYFVVVVSVFGLQCFSGLYSKYRRIVEGNIFNLCGMICLSATYGLSTLNDPYATQVNFTSHMN